MDNDQLWKAALGQLELRVSQGNFLTWFQSTTIRQRRENIVIVETPNAFTYEWLSKKYRHDVLDVLRNLDQTVEEVEFTIRSAVAAHKPLPRRFRILAHKRAKAAGKPGGGEALVGAAIKPRPAKITKTLNPHYTFANYVVGSSNEMAYAACQAVASKPGVAYNPLFIYGGVGLGKTHLLQSIGNLIIEQRPTARVLYVSSERFINEFVQSIRDNTTQKFKHTYRDLDVLIIDDVQFMAGKGKTQEELFHTFNALQSQNKQIILSSDRSPRAIPTLEERLKSRLAGGMIADIKQPDYETRLAIVTEKVGGRRAELFDEAALAFIAKNVQKNVRELEGALNRVAAHCEVSGERATLSYVKKVLEGVLEQPQQRVVDSKSILKIVSVYYSLSLEELCGKSRKKEIVRPRQIAMFLLRKENNVSFPTIGDYFGGRDHTTAMHACDKIEKLLEHDDEILQEINFIRERLYA